MAMKEKLRDLLCQQLWLVNECDLSDPFVQEDLVRLSNELQHKIINGR
jgi:hypothetical protein